MLFLCCSPPPPTFSCSLWAVTSLHWIYGSPAVVAVSPVCRYSSSILCKQPCTTANSAKSAHLNTNSPSKQALKSEMKHSTAATQTATFSCRCPHTSLFHANKFIPFFSSFISLFKIPQLKLWLLPLFLTVKILLLWWKTPTTFRDENIISTPWDRVLQ